MAQIEFAKKQVDQVVDGTHAIQAADLDGDDDLDILSATADAIVWWRNQEGSQTNWVADTLSNTFRGARFVDTADIDGDGDLDVFGAARSIDAIIWWENVTGNADQWVEHIVTETFNFAIHVFAADIDMDGDLDLLGAAFKDDAISWWENTTGDGQVWEEHAVDDAFLGARHVCVIDLDGDGDMDIVGSADLADTVAWWERVQEPDDSWAWVKHVVDASFDGINAVIPADFDADGRIDLLGVADNADEIAWWKNTPATDDSQGLVWERVSIDNNFDGAVSAFPVDMDGDGDLDVIGAAALGNSIAWWENTSGTGMNWKEYEIDGTFEFPSFITAVDMDNDGDEDILAGNLTRQSEALGDIVWWENVKVELPVELAFLDVLVDGSEVRLLWKTYTELNNAGFEVQHSQYVDTRGGQHVPIDVAQWHTIAFVKGNGTTLDEQQYLLDVGAFDPGQHAFRLKQIDFDGTHAYSPVVHLTVFLRDRHALSAPYPNPFNPTTRFSVSVAMAQRVQVDVFNTIGQRVLQLHDGELASNIRHVFDFSADHLPGGLYIIRAQGEHFALTRSAMLVK